MGGPNPLDEEAAVKSAIGRSSLTSGFTISSSTGCDWLLSSIAVISEMSLSGSSTSALASSSGRSKTIDTSISPPSFLMSSGRPSSARVALARPAEAFGGGQTAALNALQNRWLGPVAARVALARPAEAFGGGQTAASLKTDGWGL